MHEGRNTRKGSSNSIRNARRGSPSLPLSRGGAVDLPYSDLTPSLSAIFLTNGGKVRRAKLRGLQSAQETRRGTKLAGPTASAVYKSGRIAGSTLTCPSFIKSLKLDLVGSIHDLTRLSFVTMRTRLFRGNLDENAKLRIDRIEPALGLSYVVVH